MTAFSQPELATLRALASTFVPAADAARVATIASDALLRAVDPSQLVQLRLVLRVLEQPLANLATGGGFATFHNMDAPARERLLLRWAGSPLLLRRSGVHAFRKLLTFISYADPGTPEAPNLLPRALGYETDEPPRPPDLASIRPMDVDRSVVGRASITPIQLDADVVVVGSGAGAGVVAAELARAGRGVLVIEAGPYVDESTMPRDELDAFGRLYLNYGLLSTWDGAITMLAGSGVGGGTLVNWMTCLDAPAEVRAEWARDHGLDGLDDVEWATDVATIESELGVAPSVVVPPKDELIRRGATELGWESAVIRRNATDCGDCGSCPFGCPRGAKRSGIRAHLANAASRDAVILDRARVRSVIRDGVDGPVTGVRGTLAPAEENAPPDAVPRPFEVRARQVVLAAGALRSPAILQASGFTHPGIGRYLRIHPVPVIGALMPEPVDMWRGTMQAVRSMEFAQDQPSHRRYVIESAPGHLGLLSLVLPWEGAVAHAELMARARHFAPLVAVTRDGGEGRVRLTRAGRVRIDYWLDDAGRATARHALVSMARLARAAGAAEILAVAMPILRHRVDGLPDEGRRFAAFEAALAATNFAPHRGTVASAHQMGTLRMGANAATHPADPRGRIRADSRGSIVPNLYVADSSTFPTALGVNPMVTVMAMARRISRTVLAEGPPS
ncbi:MAG: GMC family oxidoreductase [Candidatus Limnocylindrales bacterium]